ncbi:31867_t:CDS:2 [Gigaspora margarita]|uniref:31867_t:CDS:1 n=1 Tax=Gigaspora margarita TaxID=4874 RepID=A0ABM8W650_GIGMA|nr:31867_t:CDS:2 [Gigaspora margarita]
MSILLYKTRQTNGTNLIKIIFNLGNCWRLAITFAGIAVLPFVPLSQCLALQYLQAIGDVIWREALSAFLLWRLKQIHNDRHDHWNSIILFTLKTLFTVPILALQRVTVVYDPVSKAESCYSVYVTEQKYFIVASITLDLLIDIYVTVRLVQILRKANRNAAQISTNISHKSKRSLFTAVMYWNFLRMFLAFLVHIESAIDYTIKLSLYIALSYAVTIDAEIVKVIEGKNMNKDSAGTEKSFKSSPSPYTPRSPRKYQDSQILSSSSDLPQYSPTEQGQISQFDENKHVVVSMKRLSFFEWATFVVGKRSKNKNSDDSYEEEIEATGADVEKGFSERRGSGLNNISMQYMQDFEAFQRVDFAGQFM